MKIKSVALFGAGAIGAYFIYGFSKAEDLDFCVIANGERKDRIEKEGFIINGETYRPAVKTPEEAHGVDLLLIATKYHGLLNSLEEIQRIADEHTVVISLLNGIDSEEILSTVIDPGQIVYSLMKISAERVGNRITFDAEKTPGLFAGERDSSAESERLLALKELMEPLPIRYHFCEEIISEQWKKYALNMAVNLPQAILGVGCGAYQDSEHVAFLRDRLEVEARDVADAYDISFGPLDDNSSRWLKKARFSTLQDLDAGRHTEADMFCGVLMTKAAAKGIAVPYTEFCFHAISALEEKNDGLFDY